MSVRRVIRPLPQAMPAYERQEEQIMRRQVEQGLQETNDDIHDVRTLEDRDAFLNAMRYQFIVMGS